MSKSRLIALYKPFGVVCQFSPAGDHPTLADYVAVPEVYPAGRLDRDSEGLLLLTDDGRLQQRLSHPRYKQPKEYLVQVEHVPDAAALQALRQGVQIRDGITRPAGVEVIPEPALPERDPPIRYRASIPTAWLKITLREGRNRQVRRMTAAVGHPTLRLHREAIGPVRLAELCLSPGMWCDLDPALPPGKKAGKRERGKEGKS